MRPQNMQVEWPAQCPTCGEVYNGTRDKGVVTRDIESGHQVYRLCYCYQCFDDRGLYDRLKEQFKDNAAEYQGYLGAFVP